MPSVTIRNIPENVHRRLRVRAARNGRSMEAELRLVLSIVAGIGRARPAERNDRPPLGPPADDEIGDGELSLDASLAAAKDDALKRVRSLLRENQVEDAA